jgi:ketosteroid isomerase-like protein
MRLVTLLLSVLLSAAPVLADDADDVRCREIAFSQSVENQDAEAFASFIEPDARFIASSVSRGAENIVAAWSVFFTADAPKIKWRPQYIEVLQDGNLALSRGPYHMNRLGPDGEFLESWGTFNSVWRKQNDGDWKIIFDAGDEATGPPPQDIQAILERELDCS